MVGVITTDAQRDSSERPHSLCRACGYSLHRLPEERCPECGRLFDPDDPGTMDSRLTHPFVRLRRKFWPQVRAGLRLIGAVGVCWFVHLFNDGAWFSFFWAPAIYLVVKRHWFAIPIFILLTPLSIAFMQSARRYAKGSPEFVNGSSLIWHPQGSINPITRIRGRIPGCGNRPANDWVKQTGQSLAVNTMFRLTGPPPGAYTGPYPTQSEAVTALAAGTKFKMPANWNGRIVMPAGTFSVSPEWFRGQYDERGAFSPDALQPTATLWKGRCLIVRIPRNVDVGLFADVYLIDAQKSQLFAMYWETQE